MERASAGAGGGLARTFLANQGGRQSDASCYSDSSRAYLALEPPSSRRRAPSLQLPPTPGYGTLSTQQQHVHIARTALQPPPAPHARLLALRPHVPRVRHHRVGIGCPPVPRARQPQSVCGRGRPGCARSGRAAQGHSRREKAEAMDRGDQAKGSSTPPTPITPNPI
ncbi:hypothetical protein A0H81_03571 [Grifola frondosa]|uniref:Uncharacterized protein n=1 Tax=Grifola frondosa TaxID=5627 RepID=A0A1C7MHX6_GRIFR|nr:hypothetical protein A0H81_03571 [Grifola frondosa]